MTSLSEDGWLRLVPITLALAQLSREAVSWRGTLAELVVDARQNKLSAGFLFRNDGPGPMKIVSLRPSCDCLTVATEKSVYAPDESGVIRVAFTIG